MASLVSTKPGEGVGGEQLLTVGQALSPFLVGFSSVGSDGLYNTRHDSDAVSRGMGYHRSVN